MPTADFSPHFACLATCKEDNSWEIIEAPVQYRGDVNKAHQWLQDSADTALRARIPEIWLYFPYSQASDRKTPGDVKVIVEAIKKHFAFAAAETGRGRVNLLPAALEHSTKCRFSAIYWGRS